MVMGCPLLMAFLAFTVTSPKNRVYYKDVFKTCNTGFKNIFNISSLNPNM